MKKHCTLFDKRKVIYSTPLLFYLGLCLFVCFPSPASAQSDALRLTTSPLPLNLSTTPGTPVSTDVRVKNDGLSPERLKIVLMKFKAYADTGAPELLERTPTDTFLDWVTFSEQEFTVSPGEWKTISTTFSPPPEAAFGYYYALLFTRASDSTVLRPGETALLGGTAVLALLDVHVPNATKSIQVKSFTANRHWYEFLPATFSVTLENTGNIHMAPRGNIFINRGEETNLAILEVNPGQGQILPDSQRAFSALWTDGFPVYREEVKNGQVVLDEQGSQQQELHWNFSEAHKLRFGRYTAKLLLVYDDGKRDIPIEGAVSFWVVPWRVVGGVSIVALFALIGLKSTFQKVWRRIFKKQAPYET